MQLFETTYKEYRCSRNAPLSCDVLLQTVQQLPGAKFCQECGFPTVLLEKSEIRGSRGTYRVKSLLGTRNAGRMYEATVVGDNQPCVIKEYLLPNRTFNKEETRQRKDAFVRVAGLMPADGKSQDFRLVSPWDAIADQQGERCYLVTKGKLESSPTLGRYLADNGALPPVQVRSILNQVLQTLQFLHSQKFRLPSGQVQAGLAHGNLGLDSLLITQNTPPGDQQFFIYVCDLSLWERLFDPPSARYEEPLPQQDLIALGYVAFYLLAGQSADEYGRPLNPREPANWPVGLDLKYQEFLGRLVGVDIPFESADAARAALLRLPSEEAMSTATGPVEYEKIEKPKYWLFALLAAILLLMILGFIFLLLPNLDRWFPKPKPVDTRVPSFADVPSGSVEGKFEYVAERDGTWTYLMQSQPKDDETLKQKLTNPTKNVEMNFRPVASPDIYKESIPLQQLQFIKANFVVTSLINDLPETLTHKPIAYDGLLVYVAFSKRPGSLQMALGGKISIENLRKLYTGQITNWKELGGPDLPVKIYAPVEPEAVYMFERLVFGSDAQGVKLFREKVNFLPTRETQILAGPEFDQGRSGIISFGTMIKTYNQCSVYPLAIDQGKGSVYPIVQVGRFAGQPVTPDIKVCGKAFSPDRDAFVSRRYALSFPLSVVFPNDNSIPQSGPLFADLMATKEGQFYLERLNLIPLPLSVSNK